MGQIRLSNKGVAIVDDDMLEQLSQHVWSNENGYARRAAKPSDNHYSQRIHMSHIIVGLTKEQREQNLVVDHINFNKLDNRRANLRIVPHRYNSRHQTQETKAKQRENIKKACAAAAKRPRTKLQLETARNQAKQLVASGKNRHFGENNPISKKVICIESGVIFDSVTDAARAKNRNYSTVRAWLNGSNPNPSSLRNVADVE